MVPFLQPQGGTAWDLFLSCVLQFWIKRFFFSLVDFILRALSTSPYGFQHKSVTS